MKNLEITQLENLNGGGDFNTDGCTSAIAHSLATGLMLYTYNYGNIFGPWGGLIAVTALTAGVCAMGGFSD